MNQNTTIRRLRHDDADAVRELDKQILGQDRSHTWDQYVERFLASFCLPGARTSLITMAGLWASSLRNGSPAATACHPAHVSWPLPYTLITGVAE